MYQQKDVLFLFFAYIIKLFKGKNIDRKVVENLKVHDV